MIISEDDRQALQHYGILRRSGRYPYGSGKEDSQKFPWEAGETPQERATAFQTMVKGLRKEGLSDTQIAEGFGMTSSQFRDTTTYARETVKQATIMQARQLHEKGMSNVAIGKKMGIGESSVRNLLRDGELEKNQIVTNTAEILRDQVKKKNYVDVGQGVELHLGVSREKLKSARRLLESEGYKLHYVKVDQLGTGNQTTMKVLTAPNVQYREVWRNRDQIQPAMIRSSDHGRTFDNVLPPLSINSKRVKVRYAEEGGANADGVIFVRRGVDDVSLGGSRYAQVRIAVDGSHYLKGMAIYHDDLPDRVDLVFNTNKSDTGNKLDAMKPMKEDPTDPFGATINRQIYNIDENGQRVVSSAMNIVNEQGKWDEWAKSLSSQMLSKQKPALAKHQLDLAYESKLAEFEQIMSLTNPTVRKHLLEKFSETADSAAVHLKAAHMPRQANKVILPVDKMSEKEVYAPTFDHGERVVLVRFPHGGKFEIPELTVNNHHPGAKKLLGNAPDAIGISSKVAERLSGADFDGDTVLVIPNNLGKIKTEPALEGLKGFDPQMYKLPDDSPIPRMNAKTKAMQMGLVSNLITDMTALGAPNDEIARAVRHSMVVIDAEKHNLNWKLSAQQNGIAQLMKKYQRSSQGGASTIISRAGSETRVLDRKLRPSSEGGPIDRATGKKVYVETGAEYYNGNKKYEKSKKLAETDDAHTLVSEARKPIEIIYADHSNRLKNLANQARKELLGIKALEYSPSAAKVYAEDVKDLEAAVNEALRNAPLERHAQVIANAIFRQKKEANPDMDASEIKKLKSKELKEARIRVGAGKKTIKLTPRQWEAIQAGAITKTMLENILKNADVDNIKELATPKDKPAMSAAQVSRAMSMLKDDKYSLADVARHLGVSVSTLKTGIAGGAE